MNRITIACCTLSFIGAALLSPAQPGKLTAPTYYIAARAENELQSHVDVQGATNLPPGARLVVSGDDFVGEGASSLTEQACPVVGQNGFFKVSLYPKEGKQFKRGMVCSIVFMRTYPQQTASVLTMVGGTHGTALPAPSTEIGHNPQASVSSGEHWYLFDRVYVP